MTTHIFNPYNNLVRRYDHYSHCIPAKRQTWIIPVPMSLLQGLALDRNYAAHISRQLVFKRQMDQEKQC